MSVRSSLLPVNSPVVNRRTSVAASRPSIRSTNCVYEQVHPILVLCVRMVLERNLSDPSDPVSECSRFQQLTTRSESLRCSRLDLLFINATECSLVSGLQLKELVKIWLTQFDCKIEIAVN